MRYVVDTTVRNSQQHIPYPLLTVESVSAELPAWGKEGLYFSSRHSPKNLLTEITEAVRAAKEVVAFQTLLLDDSPFIQELERAIKERGVRGYGVLAAEPLRKLAEEGEEHRYEQQFRELIRRLSPLMPLRISSRIHAKYLLIDPHLPTGRAFLLTSNLTQKALSENIEIGKGLEGPAVRSLFENFLYTFWEWTEAEFNEGGISISTSPLQRYRLPSSGKLLGSLSQSQSYPLYEAIQEVIQKAKNYVALSTFLIAGTDKEPIRSIIQSLQEVLKRGVKVEIFYRFHEATYQSQIFPALRSLVDAGAKVYLVQRPLLHAKFILSDGKRGWLTTANLEGDKAKETLDLGWELSVDEAEVMEEYLAWLRSKAKYILHPPCPVQELKGKSFFMVAKGEVKAVQVSERILREKKEPLHKVEDLIDFFAEYNRKYAQYELEELERKSDGEYALEFELRRIGQIEQFKAEEEVEVIEHKEAFDLIKVKPKNKSDFEVVLLDVDKFSSQRDLALLESYKEHRLFAK